VIEPPCRLIDGVHRPGNWVRRAQSTLRFVGTTVRLSPMARRNTNSNSDRALQSQQSNRSENARRPGAEPEGVTTGRGNCAEARPCLPRKASPSNTVDLPKTLSRLLNSSRDFAAAVDFLQRARNYDRAAIEYTALLLGALISYARPFKDRQGSSLGRPLHEIPIFLDAAVDLGVDLELHLKILQLSTQASGDSQTTVVANRHGGSQRDMQIHRFSFPYPSGHLLEDQLDVGAFEQISNLMRLACIFAITELGGASAKYRS
jgi:hypothetical protein